MNTAYAINSQLGPQPSVVKRIPGWFWAFFGHEVLILLAYVFPRATPSHQYTVLGESFSYLDRFLFKWDSLWFISIAHYGYVNIPGVQPLSGTVFFPWLPLLIHIVGVWPAWILTQVALAISMWLAYRFFNRLLPTTGQALLATFLLALNPATVYYSTLYAEPWTLLFALASIEFGSRHRWVSAGLFGSLAALTQATGVLVGIFPFVMFIRALYKHSWRQASGPFVWGVGCFTGIASYAVYLAVRFGQPLLFASAQHKFWYATWSLPWNQWVEVGKFLEHHQSNQYLLLWLPITIFIVSAAALWLMLRQSTIEGLAAALYATIGLIVALSFGKAGSLLHSTLRIATVYVPLYAGIAWLPKLVRYLCALCFIVAAFHGSLRFTHGWWYQ